MDKGDLPQEEGTENYTSRQTSYMAIIMYMHICNSITRYWYLATYTTTHITIVYIASYIRSSNYIIMHACIHPHKVGYIKPASLTVLIFVFVRACVRLCVVVLYSCI